MYKLGPQRLDELLSAKVVSEFPSENMLADGRKAEAPAGNQHLPPVLNTCCH